MNRTKTAAWIVEVGPELGIDGGIIALPASEDFTAPPCSCPLRSR
jgi:excinuclease UvrABC ATPase subunit